jgi:hypothetical protein
MTSLAKTSAIRSVAAVLLGLVIAAGPAFAADAIDPEARTVLQEMSKYLGGLPAFGVIAETGNEVIDLDGQKIQLVSSANLTLQRPGKLHMKRRSGEGGGEFFFDGQLLSIRVGNPGVYAQWEVPGTIDDAIRTIRDEVGLDAPGADLFYSDPFPGLMEGVRSGTHVGMAWLNGMECHHLAFRAEKVDWQIWIRAGDEPLPMKFVITSKWVTGAPQYSARFQSWNMRPRIEANRFKFEAPRGAERLESLPVDETGAISLEAR